MTTEENRKEEKEDDYVKKDGEEKGRCVQSSLLAEDGNGEGQERGGGGTRRAGVGKTSADAKAVLASTAENFLGKNSPDLVVVERETLDSFTREPQSGVACCKDKENDDSVSTLADSLAATTFDRFAWRRAAYRRVHRIGKTLTESQEDRRRKHLEEQRQRRRDLTDHARAVAFDRVPVSTEESSDEEDTEVKDISVDPDGQGDRTALKRSLDDVEEAGTLQPVSDSRKKQRLKGRYGGRTRKGRKNPYAGQLMIAEEMFDVPLFEELKEDWYSVLCPIGKRCLVVSCSGKTISRLKSGRIFDIFQSALPAGAKEWRGRLSNDYCILDCIFDQEQHIYYVLDVMCWKGYPIYDCETEFRFYWLQVVFRELGATASDARKYTYPFVPLNASGCSRDDLLELAHDPMSAACAGGFKCDGLLLFHKRTHYELGNTPLVGWIPAARISTAFVREVDMDDDSAGAPDGGGQNARQAMVE